MVAASLFFQYLNQSGRNSLLDSRAIGSTFLTFNVPWDIAKAYLQNPIVYNLLSKKFTPSPAAGIHIQWIGNYFIGS